MLRFSEQRRMREGVLYVLLVFRCIRRTSIPKGIMSCLRRLVRKRRF